MADEVKATAAEAGREALDRGKDVVQEAGATAIETAKERGREEGEELSDSLAAEGSRGCAERGVDFSPSPFGQQRSNRSQAPTNAQ